MKRFISLLAFLMAVSLMFSACNTFVDNANGGTTATTPATTEVTTPEATTPEVTTPEVTTPETTTPEATTPEVTTPEATTPEATTPAAPKIPVKSDGRPYSKNDYFFKHANKKFKTINLAAMIAGLLCVILVLLSANAFINGSLFKTPIISALSTITGTNLVRAQDELDDMADEIMDVADDDDLWEEFEDEYHVDLEDIEDELGITLKQFAKMISPLSLNNLVKLGESMGNFVDLPVAAMAALKGLLTAIKVWAGIIVLLVALAAFFKKNGLAIFGYVLAIPFFFITGGFVYFLIGSIAFITAAVLLSKLKNEYKFYRRSLEN